MTWEYALIGLIVGIIIGALAMRFGNKKLRNQQAMQHELEKNKAELETFHQELEGHFAHSAELLDNMARDYRQLYQHMAKSSSSLLPGSTTQNNPFNYHLPPKTNDANDRNTEQPEMPPRDYSDGASGLLRADRRD